MLTMAQGGELAHTRSIHIAFQHHDDEPVANLLFAEMAEARVNASRSVGELILSKFFRALAICLNDVETYKVNTFDHTQYTLRNCIVSGNYNNNYIND